MLSASFGLINPQLQVQVMITPFEFGLKMMMTINALKFCKNINRLYGH